MLAQEDLDIISVATWHKLHAPMTIAACAQQVKAVLCEKPMATSLSECHEMMTVAQRNNVKVANPRASVQFRLNRCTWIDR